jgi:hypothetical protein
MEQIGLLCKEIIKNKNMKQLLSLFLFLLPCLALAQYPTNGNQKITLGEQTTADGLVYRGLAADTTRKPSIDTMAYMVLDTTTNIIWHYKKATSNAWLRLNLLPSDTASMLTNYYRRGRTGIIQASDVPTLNQNTTGSAATLTTSRTFQTNLASTSTASFNGSANVTPGVTGTLPVANGGTNRTTMPNGYILHGDGTSVDTAVGLFWDRTSSRLAIGNTSPIAKLDITGSVFVKENSNSGNILESPSIKISNTRVSTGINDFSFSSYSFYANNESLKGEFFADGSGYFDNGTPNVYFRVGSNHAMLFGTNSFERMRISKDGEFNIGYGGGDNGNYLLQVNSQIFATNATIATSDIRFKENIQPLDKGLEIINKLKPVKFNFITTTENNFSEFDEIGFIAQDVEGALSTELFAKAVVKKLDEDKDDSPLGLMTEKLIPILVKAIQEQQALIKALEQRIINLENK